MRKHLFFVVLWGVVLLTPSILTGQTVSCDTDCNDKCRIIGDIVEPGCKVDCEIHKAAACRIKAPVPSPIPPVPGPAACGQIFDNITGAAVAACSNWDGRLDDQHLIHGAVRALIDRGFITTQDVAGVEMRWCPRFSGEGIAPRQNRIYLHTDMKQATFPSLASLVAHEVFHIRQYRRMGDANFACTYSQQYLNCNRCQDRGHPLEREAYDFSDAVEAAFLSSPTPPPPPPPPPPAAARQCQVGYGPYDWCWLGAPGVVGGACWCPTPYGAVTGIAR